VDYDNAGKMHQSRLYLGEIDESFYQHCSLVLWKPGVVKTLFL